MFAIIIAPVSDSIATAFTQGVSAARRHRDRARSCGEREITVTRFQDVWQSLAWAEDEAGLLQSEIDAFYGQRPYSVKAEHYPGNTGGEITLEFLTRPDLLRWTRHVGDTIDYLRAALNYAAYQIALTDCPSKAGSVEFPIFNDPATFQAKNRVKDFDAARLGLIESVQPYPGRAQELWWLYELARFHRHRLIRPVIDVAGEFMDSYTLISGSLDDITTERVPFTPAQPGTILIGRWHNASLPSRRST